MCINIEQRSCPLFLTQLLSTFTDIDVLYNALMHKTENHISAFEQIAKYGTLEHKDLAQIICCKVERRELVTYMSNIKKNIAPLPHNYNNVIKYCFYKMAQKSGIYLLRNTVNKLGKAAIKEDT